MQSRNQMSQSSKGIPVDWLYGLGPEESAEIVQTWRNSTYILDKLKAILERKLGELEKPDREDDYNNPQWPVLRADRNGQIRQLRNLINLLP